MAATTRSCRKGTSSSSSSGSDGRDQVRAQQRDNSSIDRTPPQDKTEWRALRIGLKHCAHGENKALVFPHEDGDAVGRPVAASIVEGLPEPFNVFDEPAKDGSDPRWNKLTATY